MRTNEFLESSRMDQEPGYLRLVRDHLQVRMVLDSPIKDTPEFAQILHLLRSYGLPASAVRDAYVAAEEFASFPEDERADTITVSWMQAIARRRAEERFRRHHGEVPGEFFDHLFAIRPSVPSGMPRNQVHEGEPLLELV